MSAGTLTRDRTGTSDIISWAFCVTFVVIGVLNLFLVHPVPGAFYIIVALIYLPRVNSVLKKKFGLSIPLAAKIVLGLALLWATLAVGELAEMAGL